MLGPAGKDNRGQQTLNGATEHTESTPVFPEAGFFHAVTGTPQNLITLQVFETRVSVISEKCESTESTEGAMDNKF